MPYIKDIQSYEVLDSRGNPTIEAKIILNSNIEGSFIVPSGASTGKHEALELRDYDLNRYNGKGVLNAIQNIHNIIKPALINLDVRNQKTIDETLINLDGSVNKANLGANAILAVSMACAVAAAKYLKIPLYKYIGGIQANKMPIPMMNVLNGGAHANFNIDFQEILIIPKNAKTFNKAVQIGSEIFFSLKSLLIEKNLSIGVGDEGGFSPKLNKNKESLDLIIEAIRRANYIPGKDVYIGLDVAASEFYDLQRKKYILKADKKELTNIELIEYYEQLIMNYPLISIEDGMAEDDYEGWKMLTEKLSSKIQLVGDDLFVTNINRLKLGVKNKMANAILIKPNQIGTLSETLQTIQFAKDHNYKVIISHRSGESEDSFIASLAVGVNAGQIKTGSLSRSERLAKYNQLLRIEYDINKK